MAHLYFFMFLIFFAPFVGDSSHSEDSESENLFVYNPKGKPVHLTEEQNNYYDEKEGKASPYSTNVIYKDEDGVENLGFWAFFNDEEALEEMERNRKLRKKEELKRQRELKKQEEKQKNRWG